MRKPTDKRSGAQSVYRAIDVLESFTLDQPSPTLSQVSGSVGLSVPTTRRLLKALDTRQMVIWDPSSHRYSLGPAIMRLAGVIMRRDDLAAIAMPALEKLRSITGETVGLHWAVGNQRVCVVELASAHPIRMASGVGNAYPIYAGAAGKVLLAWMAPEEVERVIRETGQRALTPLTITNAESLRAELERVRKEGYAISVGETVQGAGALAAPIFNSSGRPVAAVNITGPVNRWSRERMLAAVNPLLEEASLIVRQLGHPGFAAKVVAAPGSAE